MNNFGWIENKDGINEYLKKVGHISEYGLYGDEKKDVQLWLPLLKAKPTWKRGAQLLGDCLKKGTLVIGPDFIKKIEDIKIGDRVYAGNGEITRVISTMCKKSYNPMITIHTRGGLPLSVTSDHKVLVYRFGEFVNNNIKWKRRYSPGAQKKAIEHGGINSKSKTNIIFANRAAELVSVDKLTEADYLLCPLNIEFDKNIPQDMLLFMGDKDCRWMIGLFLGDGHAKKSSKTLEWGCTTDEPEIEARLCDILSLLGISWRAYSHCKNSHKARKVYTHKIEKIYNLFRKYFYDKNGYKVLPSWAINDDTIQGLLDSDGYKDDKRQYIENTSPSLVYGVRSWAINNGFTPSLNTRQRFDKRTNKTNKKSYIVSWSLDKTVRNLWRDDEYLAMPITKIEVEEGPHEEVYDIGVEHNLHTFITGSGSVVKNCASWGTELCGTTLLAIQHELGISEFIEEAATEPIYGLGRVEVYGKKSGGYSDGATGYGVAMAVHKFGTLLRIDYSSITGNSEHDLRKYNGKKAKEWGNFGCGGRDDKGKLDEVAKKYPIQTVTAIKSIQEAVSALQNGYPLTIASGIGFGDMKRDATGVVRRSGSWNHLMAILGLRWVSNKPQFRIFQSWGNSCGIQNDPGIIHPEVSKCSWWCIQDDLQAIINNGEVYAFSDLKGFPPRKLDFIKPFKTWG